MDNNKITASEMNVIYKYEVPGEIPMSPTSKVLAFQIQKTSLWVWVQHPCKERVGAADLTDTKIVSFKIVGTGHPHRASDIYIGTVQQGPFVWHLFQEAECPMK